MSDAGEPGDVRDWFRGVRPVAAERTPSLVAEAFGHLPKEAGDGDSDWFAASETAVPADTGASSAGAPGLFVADVVSTASAPAADEPDAASAPAGPAPTDEPAELAPNPTPASVSEP